MISTLAKLCLAVTIFGVVQGQNVTLSSQEVVTAASANFDKVKAETSTRLNALLTVIKATQGLVTDTLADVGNKVSNEYFLEGVQAVQGTADFIKSIDFFVATTTENVIRNLPEQGTNFYKACIAKDVSISSLEKAFNDVSQSIARIITVDINFKIALASCLIVKPEQAPGCVSTAFTSNPLPLVNETVISALNIIRGDAKCIGETVASIRNIGQLTIESVRKVYPTPYLFMVPKKFDVLEGRVLGQPSVNTSPTTKLDAAKRAVKEARLALQGAWKAKNINLESAKAYLDDPFKAANLFVDNVTVQPEAAVCKIAAKDANIINRNINGLGLLDCVNNIQAAPTPEALSSLELSLIDRETRENAASSAVQCFKSLRNSFYPTELQCCMAEAEDDYKVFLDGVKINGDVFARKSADIVALVEQCKVKAALNAFTQFNTDLAAFEKCLKIFTKITANSPITDPYITITFNPNINPRAVSEL